MSLNIEHYKYFLSHNLYYPLSYAHQHSFLDQNGMNVSNTTSTKPYYCAGTSSYTKWQLYSTTAITMTINTTSCSFHSTPQYFTAVDDSSTHWQLSSYTAIYYPTNISFTIYATSIYYTGSQLHTYSQSFGWNVNWFGIDVLM